MAFFNKTVKNLFLFFISWPPGLVESEDGEEESPPKIAWLTGQLQHTVDSAIRLLLWGTEEGGIYKHLSFPNFFLRWEKRGRFYWLGGPKRKEREKEEEGETGMWCVRLCGIQYKPTLDKIWFSEEDTSGSIERNIFLLQFRLVLDR